MRVPLQLLSARVRRDFRAARERNRQPAISREQLAARQLAAFAKVWSDATTDVPYYSELVAAGRAPRTVESWDEVRAIPVLTRATLQDAPAKFVRRSGPAEGVINTAGSTGTPLQIGVSEAERDLLRIVKLAEWQAFGYTPASRLFLIWGHAHLLGSGIHGRVNHLRRVAYDRFLGYKRANAYRLTPETSCAIAERLLAFAPSGVIGYAAALDLFARYTQSYRARFRQLKLGFVLVTTEAPPRDDSVEILRDLFGCPVVEEYGGSEFGQVAFKRASAPYHVYGDLCYLELEPELDAEPGVHPALITALYHRYTPLIRYRNGDGLMAPRVLPHGFVSAFERVAGRMTDAVFLNERDAIHSLSIFHCTHDIPDIYNVQMRLTDSGIDLLLVARPGADRAAIENAVRPRLADVHPLLAGARFVYADDVETTRAGKRRWCVDVRTRQPSCAASPAS